MQQRAIAGGENYRRILECFILFTCINFKTASKTCLFKTFWGI